MAVSTLLVVGFLDFLTGYEISFAVFYLLPVTVAAWYAGRYWGIFFAATASVTWYAAELAAGYPYSHASIPVWNASVRLIFFLVIAILLTTARRQLMAERLLALTDTLTGLSNVRAFRMQLQHEFALADRTGSPVTLAYIDLDDFKQINDSLGHTAGDNVLITTAKILQKVIREADTAARLGGDEFALILPATDLKGAQALINRLAKSFEDKAKGGEGTNCSIGAMVFLTLPRSLDEAIAAADAQMYLVKKSDETAPRFAVYSAADDASP